jgi:hypothetical protein
MRIRQFGRHRDPLLGGEWRRGGDRWKPAGHAYAVS